MNYNERLLKLEKAMSEIQEQKIREDERRKMAERWKGWAWDAVKSVLIPICVCLATLYLAK